jgi:hypothetical protein
LEKIKRVRAFSKPGEAAGRTAGSYVWNTLADVLKNAYSS